MRQVHKLPPSSAFACLDLPEIVNDDDHVTAGEHEQRERLARHMEERRLHLGDRWRDVAARADITTETLRQIRTGGAPMRPLTKRAVEQGLAWRQGSVDAILNGGDPTPIDHPSASRATPTYDSVEEELLAIANNSNRSEHLRKLARTQLDQLAAIRAAERAEAEARGELAG